MKYRNYILARGLLFSFFAQFKLFTLFKPIQIGSRSLYIYIYCFAKARLVVENGNVVHVSRTVSRFSFTSPHRASLRSPFFFAQSLSFLFRTSGLPRLLAHSYQEADCCEKGKKGDTRVAQVDEREATAKRGIEE